MYYEEQLFEAVKTEDYERIKDLTIPKTSIHIYNNQPLRIACGLGNLDMIKFLIKLGADIHASPYGPLYEACKSGHLHVVDFILSQDFSFVKEMRHALEIAASGGHLKIIMALYQKCKGTDYMMDAMQHGFIHACEEGKVEVAEFLLSRGVDIHFCSDNGLIDTIIKGHLPLLKMLFEKDTFDEKLSHALVVAKKYGHIEIIEFLNSQLLLSNFRKAIQ
jgi:ankyrin repeat protein